MIFGIPKEIRTQETRVGALPFLVKELVRRGQQVYVETGAGEDCEAPDSRYERMGATIVPSAEKLYSLSEIILKVREPQPVEIDLVRPDQAIFAFFHFISNTDLLKNLAGRGCTCLAYEYVEDEHRDHPISVPISRITGQMAVINGAYYLQKHNNGRGIVLGRVTGSEPAQVTILGAGNVGSQAAVTAAGLGARVVVLDHDYAKLQKLDLIGFSNIITLINTDEQLKEVLPGTDLLISCVQVSDKATPKLVTPEMVRTMRRGSVIIDVDVDLGGGVETSKVTHHDNPTFIVDGVVHYGVSNITAGVPKIASRALSAALIPFLVKISEMGLAETILNDPVIASGVSIYKGHIVKDFLAEEAGLPLADLSTKIQELASED